MRPALQTLAQPLMQWIQHGRMQRSGDSQAAVALLRGIMGQGEMLAVVRQIYGLAFQLEITLECQWLPREHSIMQLADYLSKQ